MWRLRQVLPLLLLSFSAAQTGTAVICKGFPHDPLRSQIVGGHEAQPHSRPYMAALKYRNGILGCGGFLVAPQWVMTAAHCDGNYRVILGAHNIRVKEPSQQVFSVEANYGHPKYIKYNQYNKLVSYNDIRLLKLNSKATLGKYVQILRLPKFDRNLSDGTPCSVAGWGRVYKDWSPDTLYETNVAIYDHGQCSKSYPELDDGQGDSGGPLVCDGVAEGIVSYGNPCPPGVYTRVAQYLDWIKETMKR